MIINHYLRIFRSISVLSILALFVGCGGGGGGGSSATAAASVDVTGTWSGTYSSTDKTDYGTISLSLTQAGSTVTGTGTRTSEAGDGTVDGSVTGTVSGNKLTTSLTDGTHIVKASLTINNNEGTGSWTNVSLDCTNGCSGTASLSLQSSTPTAPTGVTASPGDGEVTIAWTDVSGATSYNIYFSTTSGVTPANGTKIDNVISPQTLTGATNGTTYYFVVTALNANGESAASTQVSATPSGSTSAAPYMYAFINNPAGATSWLQNVYVYTDSTRTIPITNASVTINGTVLAYSSQDKVYAGEVGITEGTTVNLSVTIGSTTCTATGTQFTTFPIVTSPTSGAIWQAANDNTITWTPGTPTTGADYGIVIYDNTTKNPVLGPIYIPTSSTSYTVPAKSLTMGSYLLNVAIEREVGIPITNAAAGSNLWISGYTTFVPFTVK